MSWVISAVSALCFYFAPILWHKLGNLNEAYREGDERKRHAFRERMNGLVHAVIVVILSIYCMWTSPEIVQDKINATNGLSTLVNSIATGYFFWDSYYCIHYFKYGGWGFLVHGLVCLAVYSGTQFNLMHGYGMVFLMYEASTPFLSINWIISNLKIKAPLVADIMGVLLVITFVFFRLISGVYCSLNFWVDLFDFIFKYTHGVDSPIKLAYYIILFVGNATLNVLNFYWFSKIIEFIMKGRKKQKDY
eukprot:TRINITY_DN8102_c0_g1_i1.p1 TRINITY_DN8102_c0_g1~~TRINITY_DN8102_c0_g1_i1.p1  ORF type:complete len:248 (+),score=9.59 TRINITY_DN8102_c0_g1_i1:81-824(+)